VVGVIIVIEEERMMIYVRGTSKHTMASEDIFINYFSLSSK
jgi:hypothetical protein